MQADQLIDWGRSRGETEAYDAYQDNHGPLVAENRLSNNELNGMLIRGATLTTSRFVMMQIQGIFVSALDSLHIFRVNIAAPGGAITALFAFANPTSAGFVANALETSTVVGHMPFAEIVGLGGVGWIRLYDGAT